MTVPIPLTSLTPGSIVSMDEHQLPANGDVAVLVRLREGASLPTFARLRARFSPTLVSVNVAAAQFVALREHAAVVAVSLAKHVQVRPPREAPLPSTRSTD